MKKKNLLYSLVTLTLIALIIGVISYATERHPTQTGSTTTSVDQIAAPVTSTSTEGKPTPPAVKKKSCGCCAERIARLQKQMRKARARRPAAQQTSATETSQQQPSRISNAP